MLYVCVVLCVCTHIIHRDVIIVPTGKVKHNNIGHSFKLHPEAVYAVVDDLELPSNEGVAKVGI